MGKVTGFLEYPRQGPSRRPVPLRIHDFREVYEPFQPEKVVEQAGRCMDCGIPFCHEGCPLGNLIPEWNDLVWRGDWSDASERLHATNNFPEFTGRLCPAPCEGSCVLGINSEPVNIKQVEVEIAERAFAEGWVVPVGPSIRTSKRVAVVGSGPSGLAAAQQLARAGHEVVVFERAERPGGLLRYGIPEFKMEKRYLDRRLLQLAAEGVHFRTGVVVGMVDPESLDETGPAVQVPGDTQAPQAQILRASQLREDFDAVLIATGCTVPRDLDVQGRHLKGVHVAMEYLKSANLVTEGALSSPSITAEGKHVVIIGGGDTGADCLGTVHRQGALSVHQLEIRPRPPDTRSSDNPWPTWPLIFRSSSAHEEGGERLFSVETAAFLGEEEGSAYTSSNGSPVAHTGGRSAKLRAIRLRQVEMVSSAGQVRFVPIAKSEIELPCELALLAMGFIGTERHRLVAELGLELTPRGTIAVDSSWMTSLEGVFACGDSVRGQSLIVWAISEGRSAAAGLDRWLMGETALPSPIVPGQMALR